MQWEKDLPHLVVVVSTKDAIIAESFSSSPPVLRSTEERGEREAACCSVHPVKGCSTRRRTNADGKQQSQSPSSSSESCTRMREERRGMTAERRCREHVSEFTHSQFTTPACPFLSSVLFFFLPLPPVPLPLYLLLPISFVERIVNGDEEG